MKQIKKISSLLVALLLITSCGTEKSEERFENEDNQNATITTSVMVAETTINISERVDAMNSDVLGSVEDNSYTSKGLGFSFEGKDIWTLSDCSDYVQEVSSLEDDEVGIFLKSNGLIIILNAINNSNPNTNFQISILPEEQASQVFTDEEACNMFLEIVGSSDNVKNKEALKMNLAGNDIWMAHIVYSSESNIPEYYQSYFMIDGNVISFTVNISSNEYNIDDICSAFTKLN